MQPGGHNPNPRGNAAPFGRYSNGAGFRRGSTGPNAPPYQHPHPAAAPPPHVMTPQRRAEVLLQAGRLAAEYLVSIGELPMDALQGRQPPFQGYQHQRPPPPPPPQPGHPFHEGQPAQHRNQAAGPSQHRWIAPRPQGRIAKRPVGRATFQGRGRGRFPFPPPGQGRAPFPPPGASGAAAPETAGDPGQGTAAAPGAGGVGGVRGDGFDAPAPAGPSSSRQPSQQPGGAAQGQPEKAQSAEHSNSGGCV